MADSRADPGPPKNADVPARTLAECERRKSERFHGIPTKPHPEYGTLWAPERPDQLLMLLREIPESIRAWRGQAQAGWLIHSSLVRRYNNQRALPPQYGLTEANVRAQETALVEHARAGGFAEGLSELEVLARLQHHGAATRLLDCTRNAFSALWFACQGEWELDGLLIGFRLGHDALKLDTEMLKKSVDELLKLAEGRALWWQPRGLSLRIPAQQAVFVLGQVVAEPWGSIRFGDSPIDGFGNVPGAALVLVPSTLKEAMHRSWSDLFGFSEEALFPDFEGFSRAHAVSCDFPKDFPLGHTPRDSWISTRD